MSIDAWLLSEGINKLAHWKLDESQTDVASLEFSGGTDIIQQDDLTASPWFWNASHMTVVAGSAGSGPFGYGVAYTVTGTTTTASIGLNANNRTPVKAVGHTALVWLKAGTATTCEIGILQTGFQVVGATVLYGPGSVGVSSARVQVSGLSTTEWTLVSLTSSALVIAATADLLIYPGGVASTTAGRSVLVGSKVRMAATEDSPAFTLPTDVAEDSGPNGYDLLYVVAGSVSGFPEVSPSSRYPEAGPGKGFTLSSGSNYNLLRDLNAVTGSLVPAVDQSISFVVSETAGRTGSYAFLYSCGADANNYVTVYIDASDHLAVAGAIGGTNFHAITSGAAVPSRQDPSVSPFAVLVNIKAGTPGPDIYIDGVKQSVASHSSTYFGAGISIGEEMATYSLGLDGAIFDVLALDSNLTDDQVSILTLLLRQQSAESAVGPGILPAVGQAIFGF